MIFNMSSICYFTLFVSSINFVFIKSERNLLFDVKQNSLVQVEAGEWSSKPETLCHYCAAARPTSTHIPEEVKYNEEKSVGKNALILEDVYEKSVDMNQIEFTLPKCETIIKPSYLYNKISHRVELGYEILDKNRKIGSFQMRSNPDDFLSLNPFSLPRFPGNRIPKEALHEYISSNIKTHLSEQSAQRTTTQPLSELKIWIPVLLINLNIETMSPTQIEYHPDLGSHKVEKDCSNFIVAHEYYDVDIHISSYSDENQRLLLTGDENQPTPIPKGEPPCGQKFGCLVQHQIIPAYYLHSSYGKSATCSFMNTVPIWGSIVERINIINKYLYAMSQIWTSQIHITTGFFKVLKLSKEHFKKTQFADKELYLDQANKNIPVPMIIYKIVEYKMKIPPFKTLMNYYYAVIIIHNDPTSNAGNERICKTKNTLEGWKDIANKEVRLGLTYVCPFNKKVALKLQLDRDKYEKSSIDLRPDSFPLYNATQRKCLYQDKRQEIQQKVQELF